MLLGLIRLKQSKSNDYCVLCFRTYLLHRINSIIDPEPLCNNMLLAMKSIQKLNTPYAKFQTLTLFCDERARLLSEFTCRVILYR